MTVTQSISNSLGYAGLVPFIVPAGMIVADSEHATFLISFTGVYAFGIICFLCGSWWGRALTHGSRSALLLSNLYFLIAFFGFLFANQVWPIAAAVLLMGIYLAEQHSSLFSGFSETYRKMRTILTLIASVSMLVIHIAG
ncbi:MAG: hypothetical protein ACI9JR_000422 [Gammaproteobacteria bacterium]|jgi:hypothetical protein